MAKLCFSKLKGEVNKGTFTCGDDSIDKLVESSYYPTILQQSYAYEIMGEGELLGYYMIHFRRVEVSDFPDDISDHFDDDYIKDGIIALHIHYIAIKKEYQKKGIGKAVLRTIISQVKELSENWPVRVITIDAEKHLIKWYEKEGFKYMTNNRDGQDDVTEAMYKDCHRYGDEVQEYEESYW